MSSRTIARLFDSYSDAASAVRDLEAAGFSHDDVSLVANRPEGEGSATEAEGETGAGTGAGTGATLGTIVGGGAGLLGAAALAGYLAGVLGAGRVARTGLGVPGTLDLGMALVAAVSFIEVTSSARVAAARTGARWNVNQELVGQGLAKIAAGLFGAFPVSGSFSRSALNLSSGARSASISARRSASPS